LAYLVLDKRRDLTCFSHRAGLQMSQNDSFELFGNYKAASLQIEGSSLPCALYMNMETNDAARFKPYAAVVDGEKLDHNAHLLQQAFSSYENGD